ncbi:MAG: hypothetical protein RJA70_1497 [Pseudomonadota bacterium]
MERRGAWLYLASPLAVRAVCIGALTCGAVVSLTGCQGCNDETAAVGPAASSSANNVALTPEQEARVLAKVGERNITLGDYVTALSRLDQFERLRYQTPERRQLFLDEMINVELLAREAERRGLDKQPETQAHLRQVLREEVVRTLRAQLPNVEELPAGEVRAYYDAHPKEFADPSRRRVALIAVRSRALADTLVKQAQAADARDWGKLARAHSVLKSDPKEPGVPLEFEGDMGLVSAAESGPSDNLKVPVAVRDALFALEKQGAVASHPVEYEGLFYLVRLLSVHAPRQRTLPEVDTVIRVRLLHERLAQAEAKLEFDLRKQIPVSINQDALSRLVPSGNGGSAGTASEKP